MAASNGGGKDGGSPAKKGKPRGRPFTKGGPPGPGRPARAVEENYLAAIKRAVTSEDMERIAGKAREQALRGDRYAREWLSKQFGTEAAQKIEQDVRQTTIAALTDDVSKILSDPETTEKLLDAIQGQAPSMAIPAVKIATENGGNGNGTNGAGTH